MNQLQHLLDAGMTVYISLPRLRKASGAEHRAGVSDDELTRIVSLLSARFLDAKVVISTREAPEIQQRLLPVIGVLTAGSPGVAPYDESVPITRLTNWSRVNTRPGCDANQCNRRNSVAVNITPRPSICTS